MPVYKIYLSPSNQTANVGVNGYNEAEEMHKLADRIKYHLALSPMFNVRISDIKWDLEAVAKDSILWKSDLHICLHTDAGPEDAQGTTAFFYAKGGKGEIFANTLYKKIAPLSPGPDRDVVVRPGLYELRKTPCPAVLIENFFHTNKQEVDHYKAHFEDYAKQTALAIYEFFEVPYPEPVPSPPPAHWAEPYYKKLTETYGIKISSRDFDKTITRGEVFVLLCRMIDANKTQTVNISNASITDADVDIMCKKIIEKLKTQGVC